jgi:thymidine kinase
MSLHLILGPMFSGKTSKLLEIYEKCVLSNISVLVINHSNDTRYSDDMLSTHNKKMIPCVFANELNDIFNNSGSEGDDINTGYYIISDLITKYDVILINEGQFFCDLYHWVKLIVESFGKKVYVCGLDGDSNRNKFGQMLDLIPICDKVTKLRSLCVICKNGTKAPFTLRTTSINREQVLIGSEDVYKPVCRKCYCYNTLSFNEEIV